jgi:hypothetical protein
LFLPFPYDQAQAVINPCRDDVPATRLAPAVRLRAIREAVKRALATMPTLPVRSPGTISRATRRAVVIVCRVYGRAHQEPQSPLDNPAALAFAWECLRAWRAPIGTLEPADVISSLRKHLGQKST